jgi:hypothetical protein
MLHIYMIFGDVDVVFHYTANPEVRVSVTESRVEDFEGNHQLVGGKTEGEA